jgi:hypothetical protein
MCGLNLLRGTRLRPRQHDVVRASEIIQSSLGRGDPHPISRNLGRRLYCLKYGPCRRKFAPRPFRTWFHGSQMGNITPYKETSNWTGDLDCMALASPLDVAYVSGFVFF